VCRLGLPRAARARGVVAKVDRPAATARARGVVAGVILPVDRPAATARVRGVVAGVILPPGKGRARGAVRVVWVGVAEGAEGGIGGFNRAGTILQGDIQLSMLLLRKGTEREGRKQSRKTATSKKFVRMAMCPGIHQFLANRSFR